MRRFVLVSLLFLGLCLPLEAQEAADSALSVEIVTENPGADVGFSGDDLEDAATVLLTAKAPDIDVVEDAPLLLYVVPNCLSLRRSYVCSLSASLLVRLSWSSFVAEGSTGSPFGGVLPRIVLWSKGSVLTGSSGDAFSHVRETLDQDLDEPIAAWRRVGEQKRQCWISFLNRPEMDLLGDDKAELPAFRFVMHGPCALMED